MKGHQLNLKDVLVARKLEYIFLINTASKLHKNTTNYVKLAYNLII